MNGCQDNTQALIHPHASANFHGVCSCSIHPFPAMYNERVSLLWLKLGFSKVTKEITSYLYCKQLITTELRPLVL